MRSHGHFLPTDSVLSLGIITYCSRSRSAYVGFECLPEWGRTLVKLRQPRSHDQPSTLIEVTEVFSLLTPLPSLLAFGRSGLFGPPLCGGSAPATPPQMPCHLGAAFRSRAYATGRSPTLAPRFNHESMPPVARPPWCRVSIMCHATGRSPTLAPRFDHVSMPPVAHPPWCHPRRAAAPNGRGRPCACPFSPQYWTAPAHPLYRSSHAFCGSYPITRRPCSMS